MESSETDVIRALLHQLESEERALSRRRQKLHARIATFTDTNGSRAEEELELSKKRRALHRQIDQLLDRADARTRAGRNSGDVLA
jgi:hypothetical protein